MTKFVGFCCQNLERVKNKFSKQCNTCVTQKKLLPSKNQNSLQWRKRKYDVFKINCNGVPLKTIYCDVFVIRNMHAKKA